MRRQVFTLFAILGMFALGVISISLVESIGIPTGNLVTDIICTIPAFVLFIWSVQEEEK